MHEVMTELMMALWSHLRPSPIQFGKKVGFCRGHSHRIGPARARSGLLSAIMLRID